jgi:ABC-type branched-subunit amino acid transport system substrate-binding protein
MRHRSYLLGLLAVSASLTGLVMACSSDEAGGSSSGASSGSLIDGGSDAPTAPQDDAATCPPAPAAGECTNTKCTTQLGEPAACIENACVKLKQLDCTEVFGDLKDDAILFATVFPLFGANATSGKARRQAVQLAVDEINKKGVPTSDPCVKPRPLAFLSCSDTSGVNYDDAGTPSSDVLAQRLKDVGTHLTTKLKLPFVIGAGTSGNTTTLASVLLPAKTMLMAPSATAVSITTLPDATQDGVRLMWRTAPPDSIQGAALIGLYSQVEPIAKAANGGANPKVAIISKSDAYGVGIDGVLKAGISINGKTFANATAGTDYVADCYNASGSTAACDVAKTPTSAFDALKAATPDVIVLTGTAEAVTGIMIPYETHVRDNSIAKKPIWLLPDGPRRVDLTDFAKANPTLNLGARVRGTIPGVVTPLAQEFYNFRYAGAYPNTPLIFGMAGAYDATYMFAYVSAALGNGKVTGVQVAKGFEKVVGGTERIDVGPTKLTAGLNLMTKGQKLDFNGASGPLEFDFTKGEAPSDVNVWCVSKDPNTGFPIFNDTTGQTYDSTGKVLKGVFSCPQ